MRKKKIMLINATPMGGGIQQSNPRNECNFYRAVEIWGVAWIKLSGTHDQFISRYETRQRRLQYELHAVDAHQGSRYCNLIGTINMWGDCHNFATRKNVLKQLIDAYKSRGYRIKKKMKND